ncbi:YeiH family protein [Roseibium sp.]|uniref:YeiH family protein n=1 Tax=Roseibium sp. TaxID=1936156 RepID=UPI003A97C32E
MSPAQLKDRLPGLLLCGGVAGCSLGFHWLESRLTGTRFLDPFTCAILLGIGLGAFYHIGSSYRPGIRFSAASILEVAVVLLGFSIDFGLLMSGGLELVGAVVLLVFVVIIASFTICRAVGIREDMAVLIACGNSICGNAAIAAVAPAIKACDEDVAAAISFSAVLGVLFVIALPYLAPYLALSDVQYGTFAGLTVYAVPQVVAATAPVSLASAQVGTSIKLIRVLMLVPVVITAPFLRRNRNTGNTQPGKAQFNLKRIFPWFIPAFVAAATLNTCGAIPEAVATGASSISRLFFVIAMAGLGLSVDLGSVLTVSYRLVLALVLSLGTLSLASYVTAQHFG